jgi:hypothetical protein
VIPSYRRMHRLEVLWSRLVWYKARLCFKNKESKTSWKCDSNSTVSARQVQDPEFKVPYHQNQTKSNQKSLH